MRKTCIFAGLYALYFALCIACFISADNIAQQCHRLSLRYTQPITEHEAEKAIEGLHTQAALRGITAIFTRNETLMANSEYREAKMNIVFYKASGGGKACYITTAAAQQLFGAQEVKGLSVRIDNREYSIANVISSRDKALAVSSRGGEYSAIELGGELGTDRQSTVLRFIRDTGLREAQGVLYRQSLAGLAGALCYIPIALCAGCTLWVLAIRATRLKGLQRAAALFALGLVCVGAVVACAYAAPAYLLPARISDAGAWGEVIRTISRMADMLIMLPPSPADIPLWHAIAAHLLWVVNIFVQFIVFFIYLCYTNMLSIKRY